MFVTNNVSMPIKEQKIILIYCSDMQEMIKVYLFNQALISRNTQILYKNTDFLQPR